MGGRGSNSMKRVGGIVSITRQIRQMAKQGKMPGAIMGGSNADQIKAYETIQDSYPVLPRMTNYMQTATITDQPDSNRWYIRANNKTTIVSYPKNATDKAKRGALKHYLWHETNK